MFLDQNDNAVPSNAGNPMDNTNEDMTQPSDVSGQDAPGSTGTSPESNDAD